jgi:putative NADH-flavin reductase
MRLTIFGATGGTGTQLVRQALDAGHEVTTVVRDPAGLTVPQHSRLRVVRADVMDPEAIVAAVEDADAVVSALGRRPGSGSARVCSNGVRSILAAMDKAGVRRLAVVSAAGAYNDPDDGLVTRLLVKPLLQRLLREGFADTHEMDRDVQVSGTEWTIVRPPQLTNGRRRGRYRTATDHLVGRRISRADLADAILRTITDPATVRHTLGAGY